MARFEAEVVVMPKAEVADPQGQAIEGALARLGLTGTVQAHHVHVGKVFRLALEAADQASAEHALRTLADRVLANPNIETFKCSVR
jgi:phosphoribosylformylglycinamidine synthase subunit PurS